MRAEIIILDFGSQYNQLIARRIREMGVYAEVYPYTISIDKIRELSPKGIILSGGPASVYEVGAPTLEKEILALGIPILGICYGMQLVHYLLGGKVERASQQEFGKTEVTLTQSSLLTKGFPEQFTVWMSHGDHVIDSAPGFELLATTNACQAILGHERLKIYTIQYHAEVTHTEYGGELLKNFVFGIAQCHSAWNMENFVSESIRQIQEVVQNEQVILGLSGGVDSSVAAVLIHQAIGKQLTCIFVDTGLLRKDEAQKVKMIYEDQFHLSIRYVDASERFLSKLVGVSDPEMKRKIIGQEFIEVFQEEAKQLRGAKFLAQGTIYPDVIESQSIHGPSMTIKSHHNVGGLPLNMSFKLLEPLRTLFKDEVRALGRVLNIPEPMIMRHPFPGPGLGIRVIGEVTQEKCDILREADAIFIEELEKHGLYSQVSQAFVVLLPVQSVGVMGDVRTYEYTAVLRSADSTDFMTATWSRLPYEFLELVSNRIINEVRGINRLTYDISSKPPATIEWE